MRDHHPRSLLPREEYEELRRDCCLLLQEEYREEEEEVLDVSPDRLVSGQAAESLV